MIYKKEEQKKNIDREITGQPDFTRDMYGNVWTACIKNSQVNLSDTLLCVENITAQEKHHFRTDRGRLQCLQINCDNYNRLWLVYCLNHEGHNKVKLMVISTEEVQLLSNINITEDYGKYRHPVFVIRDNLIYLAWESYEKKHSSIQFRRVVVDKNRIKEIELNPIETVTGGKSYRPCLIFDREGNLYLFYESYINDRYQLQVRVLTGKVRDFTLPFSIGYEKHNDLLPSVCQHQGKVLVAWENTQPLKKGYIWEKADGGKVVIPAFGHGWRVENRLGLRRISYNSDQDQLDIERLDLKYTDSFLDGFNINGSAGAPCIFTGSQGQIFLAYLDYNSDADNWEIIIKLYQDKEWIDVRNRQLFNNRRTPPSVFLNNKNKLYLYGSDSGQRFSEKIHLINLRVPENIKENIENANYKTNCYIKEKTIGLDDKGKTGSNQNREKLQESDEIEYQGSKLQLLWGDLHMHSNISPCSKHPAFHCTEIEEKYRYSQDVGRLDFAMVTDHDRMIDYDWHRTVEAARFNNFDGGFVSFNGYEWTSSMMKEHENYGHLNVLYLEEGPLLRCDEERSDTPPKLWNQLSGYRALTIPHHPSDIKHPVNWDYYNPEMEPLVEIFQVRGSYEADNCLHDPVQYGREVVSGHSVQDALELGYQLGFTAGGEHEGVGVTAVFAENLNRKAIFKALQARHTYGTTGARIFLDFRVNGYLMGEEIKFDIIKKDRSLHFMIRIKGEDQIKKITLIDNGNVLKSWNNPGDQKIELAWDKDMEDEILNEGLRQSHYYYLRVEQFDGEMAWSSPVFLQNVGDNSY